MKSCWYATGSYCLNRKGKKVALISIGRGDKFAKNHVQIVVPTADKDDLGRFFWDETDETVDEFKANIKYCAGCASCSPGVGFTFLGDVYANVCFRGYGLLYVNSAPEQYERIKNIFYYTGSI